MSAVWNVSGAEWRRSSGRSGSTPPMLVFRCRRAIRAICRDRISGSVSATAVPAPEWCGSYPTIRSKWCRTRLDHGRTAGRKADRPAVESPPPADRPGGPGRLCGSCPNHDWPGRTVIGCPLPATGQVRRIPRRGPGGPEWSIADPDLPGTWYPSPIPLGAMVGPLPHGKPGNRTGGPAGTGHCVPVRRKVTRFFGEPRHAHQEFRGDPLFLGRMSYCLFQLHCS